MGRRERDAEIRGLARKIISEVVPEDLSSFGPQADAYFAHRRRFRRTSHRDRPNAFGGAVTAIVIVVVLKILDKVFDAAAGKAVESLWDRVWRRHRPESRQRQVEPATLDELIVEELKVYDGLDPERTAQLAAAIRSAVVSYFKQDGRADQLGDC